MTFSFRRKASTHVAIFFLVLAAIDAVDAFVLIPSSSSSSSFFYKASFNNNHINNNKNDIIHHGGVTVALCMTTENESAAQQQQQQQDENDEPNLIETAIVTPLTRMATDVYRRVRWGDAVTPASSAAMYMNPVTVKIASHLTVSWEPEAAEAIRAAQTAAEATRKLNNKVVQKKKNGGTVNGSSSSSSSGSSNTHKAPFMVGVVGIPGSGKSTSCDILAQYLNNGSSQSGSQSSGNTESDTTIVLPMDGYHLSLAQLAQVPDPADALYRRGAPDTFDPASLIRDLKRIKGIVDVDDEDSATQPPPQLETLIHIPGFDHAVGDPTPDQHVFDREQHEICIVEGIYLLHDDDGWQDVRNLLDYTIYIQADVDDCMERLKIRNQCIPGYTVEEIQIRCDAVDRVNAETVVRNAAQAATLTVQSTALARADQTPAQQAQDESCETTPMDVVLPSPPPQVEMAEVEQAVETVEQQAEAIIQEL